MDSENHLDPESPLDPENPVNLSAAVEELYAGSPDDFVARRKMLVSQARAAKNRSLAITIGQLRRPTRSAWLVNLYARDQAEDLAELLRLGQALQTAQQQLAGSQLRRLSVDRHRVIEVATERAVALGQAQGYTAPVTVRQEIAQTLQAALADTDVAGQVRDGRVVAAQTYGGFGPFGLAPKPSANPTEAEQRFAAQRRAAEQRLRESEDERDAAAAKADELTERADELADRVEALRTELAATERAESEVRRDAHDAHVKVGELDDAVLAARAANCDLDERPNG
ncbi:MAG: hypothetical protein L0H41_16465 [Microlunatus sp.]|nr:hypothetical protein [Microlunatus sp.]MDN5770141.1 hypothetical protein [Microlunatus sp.]MDN5803532.1 hypothetical protein [Microlunatus sp.]